MTVSISTGPRATRTADSADPVEREFVSFVRRTAHWLDPEFPTEGHRGPSERGKWTDDAGVVTLLQQVEEFDTQGRGIRSLRLMRLGPPSGPHESTLRVVAVGMANAAQLELCWNFATTDEELRGASAELTVSGAGEERCVAAFRDWFDGA